MKKLTLYILSLIFSWFILLLACSAQVPPINVDADGVTLKGYDPVAYFTEGHPVKGQETFQHEWQGAKWRFASQEHLDMFRENPEKYAPQYGSY
jgi:YHS domain-containing protein